MFYGINAVLNRGGEGLQRGSYSMFLANLNVNQKPALCSRHCSQLELYIKRPQTSYSFRLRSSERCAFPWLRGEILSLAAPRSGGRQENNLLCPRAPRCWLQSGRGTATGQLTGLATAGAISPLPVREPPGQPLTDALGVSEHRFAEGKSQRYHPWVLHPWKGLGDAVITISHRSRAPAPLDGLGKQILRFPC